MDRPEFSEVLYRRRLELGVTTNQAARALRLKERVLVAFEEGDWYSMPKSGYAQGMLSSYARYLGLDTREITEMFTRDLEEFQDMQGSDDNRLKGPDSTSVVSPRGRYSGARGLLPTSGGYAGDMEGFSAVSSVRAHGAYGSYGQAVPSEGAGSVRQPGAANVRLGSVSGRVGAAGEADDDTGERRYTTRQPGRSQARGRTRSQAAGSVRVEGREAGARGSRQRQRAGYRPRVPVEEQAPARTRAGGTRDHVTTRRVSDGDYVDDLRYNDQAESYQAASTRGGRVGSRTFAAPERPNIQRRSRDAGRGRQQSGGVLGRLGSMLANSGNLMFVIVIVAAIILTVIIVSSVSSCVANATSTGREAQVVSTVQEEPSTGSEAASTASADEEAARQQAEAEAAAAASQATEQETKVEVSVAVADAGITWVEITLDGQTVVAETKTGPWSATYTVTRSMKIDVSEPAVVTVTRNGAVQTFENKASGVGTITIEGPDLPEETEEQTDSEGTTSSGQYTVLQYNDDGSWYDENWYYHDGNGGYYTDDGAYHQE